VQYLAFLEATPPGDIVELPTLLELGEAARSEGLTIGVLVTPYAIADGGIPEVDGAIHVIDGPRLRQLVAVYLPGRLAELARYRGLGGAAADVVRRGAAPPTTVVPKPVG
jgi:hypothetical protein